jgi:hypothetical protein
MNLSACPDIRAIRVIRGHEIANTLHKEVLAITRQDKRPPESPTAIGMDTGMDVPGLADVRGTLEEALVLPPTSHGTGAEALDLIPGQSGAEGAAPLPGSSRNA